MFPNCDVQILLFCVSIALFSGVSTMKKPQCCKKNGYFKKKNRPKLKGIAQEMFKKVSKLSPCNKDTVFFVLNFFVLSDFDTIKFSNIPYNAKNYKIVSVFLAVGQELRLTLPHNPKTVFFKLRIFQINHLHWLQFDSNFHRLAGGIVSMACYLGLSF